MITYLEAIRKGLRDEMKRDPSVFLIGEDIGEYGGAFKVTQGLLAEFGSDRVIDTPLAEAGFTGAAIGAAMMGMRPVVEFQFADFISCAFDQITNFGAKLHYRLGIPVPVVFRAPAGGGIHGGPFHSQNPEMYFVPTPGLKVVAAATVADANGLLKAAIRDNNPVLFLEYKYLYRRLQVERLPQDHVVSLGKAALGAEGDRLTILTYGTSLHVCQEALEDLPSGTVDLVDLRSLVPLDEDLVFSSVKKTGKVLIVHEDTRTGGFAGELTARLADQVFEFLDGPIRRVTGPDTPVPYSPPLERAFLPSRDEVATAAMELIDY